ncbi:MAG: methylenetetrahydrofolate--tRNA-(uracil(54)-C(5))-methyltransferase (FADH(2)-oxidizing) TrmFO [Clostridia bacterium]
MNNLDKVKKVVIIGAGLAGSECAYKVATSLPNIDVIIYEMKPKKFSPAHHSENFAELVCSNSLKSSSITNACGLLKKEMEVMGSIMMDAANISSVPAGQALAVDRDIFSEYITKKIKALPNVKVIYEEAADIKELAKDSILVIATGPLTSEKLFDNINELLGNDSLYFYDAAAPIVDRETIDMSVAYEMDRYSEVEGGDYINLPMNEEQYTDFYENLITAEQAERKAFDKLQLFEGCMPVEEMAKRGKKTLVFGPLKPVGLVNPHNGELPYAVVQLRSENKEKTMYNLVGFQTSLKFGEQDRVFKKIPGLANAKFERYGVMHRNTFINAPKVLNDNFCMKDCSNIYFAGQITGVEGYVESAASGIFVALSIINRLKGGEYIHASSSTMIGSLAKHVSEEKKHYQPMNANFGIIKPLEHRIRDKQERYTKLAEIAMTEIKEFIDGIN